MRNNICQIESSMRKNLFFHIIKLVMLLFDSLKTNSENYSNTFYLVTLNEEIDCGRKDRGKKECKFNNQYRIICGIEEYEFVVYLRNC